jgi:spore coat polysaccharide biosynthesis protein SpsF
LYFLDFQETLMNPNMAGGYYRHNGIDYPPVMAIVQARLGSKRFPNKMLSDLCGKPVIQWVCERLKKAKTIHQVVVASPDKEIVELANKLGMWGFHDLGDPNNVLSRYIKASNWSNAELVVRICGDCPLIDPELVDQCVNIYMENRVDIVTNVLRRTYAKGMDVEVMHRNVLKRLIHLTDSTEYREHVTLYAYDNPSLFVFKSVKDFEDLSWLNVSIDTPDDLDRVARFMATLKSDAFNYEDIKKYFRRV